VLDTLSVAVDAETFLRTVNLEDETYSPIFIVFLADAYGNRISHAIIWTSLQLRGKRLTFVCHTVEGLFGSLTLPGSL
jgi:hypothetical protein